MSGVMCMRNTSLGNDRPVSSAFADYVEPTLKVYFLGGLGILRGCLPSL